MKKIVSLIILILLIAGAVVVIKKKQQQLKNAPTPLLKPLVVKVAKPRYGNLEETKSYIGFYHSLNPVEVSSKISAKILKVYVKEGDRVQRGDLLIRLESKDIDAKIANTKASLIKLEANEKVLFLKRKSARKDLELAQSIYERNKKLFHIGGISKESLQRSLVALQAKKAALAAIEADISSLKSSIEAAKRNYEAALKDRQYIAMRSPVDGEVAQLLAHQGDLAMPGKPLVKLFGDKRVVDFTFDGDVKAGMKVYIDKGTYTIDQILPQSKNGLPQARVVVDFGSQEGKSMEVKVVHKRAQGVVVPNEAIIEKDGKEYLFVYDRNFKPTEVKILARDGRYSLIDKNITAPVATGSYSKLLQLFVTENVEVIDED